MRAKGMTFDLNEIRPENLEEIIEQLDDLEVNVDEDKAKVKIFCE
jgi:predicted nucleotide-binding protein (sugar kinase/HSP70/actin superfamily)